MFFASKLSHSFRFLSTFQGENYFFKKSPIWSSTSRDPSLTFSIRWLRVFAVMEHQIGPALQRLALGLDWLNMDFQRNILHLLDRAVLTIQQKLEGRLGLESFSLARLVSRSPGVLQCR